MIARSGLEAKDIAPLLAALLSIYFEGRYPALEMAPSEQKEGTIDALLALLEGLTKNFQSWRSWRMRTGSTRLRSTCSAVSSIGCPVSALCWSSHLRPEFAAPWVGRAHVASLQLSRFGRRQALAMVAGVAGGKALPVEVLDEIVAKTDGVPLFVEELTKTVLKIRPAAPGNGAYVLDRALTPLAIPSTLQGLADGAARSPRAGQGNRPCRSGDRSRVFLRLLEAISPIRGAELQDALAQLMAAELIHGRGAPPEATYVFKHALVQDTAYGSLLRSRRQRIHADIARALEEKFADQVAAAPAAVTHHYTEAELADPAARYWLAAGELALSRSAYAEADRYVDAGLALIPRLPRELTGNRLSSRFMSPGRPRWRH